MTDREAQRRFAGFADALRRQGVKATHQRVEILRELAATEEHPDAETLYRKVRRRLPTLSRDTVYRTLGLLEDSGLVVRVHTRGDRARFDANTERHHHFVCETCGRMGDFTSAAPDRLPIPPAVARMGRVETVYVELRGVCRTCQTQAGKRPRAKGGTP